MFKTLFLTSLAVLGTASDAPAAGNGFVRFGITGSRPSDTLERRQSEVDLTSQQTGNAYTIKLGFGTPAQFVAVQLDTGSTDLWVNPNCAGLAAAAQRTFCASLGTYDYTKSSTFKNLGTSYTLIYGIGNASISWVTDTIAVGSKAITSQQFGVARSSSQEPFGILGIGPNVGGSHPVYSYFIDTLASQGVTASRAFSLDLRSIDSPDGSIIFGGLDTKKFTGSLEKVPIIPAAQAPNGDRYWVSLASIAVVTASGTTTTVSSSSIPVVLDSGSTLTTLPASVFRNLISAFPNARIDAASGLYIIDCSVANQAGTVDFTFGKKTIKVAFKDFIWHATASVCVIGAQGIAASASVQVSILGDTVLRAAYAVFDQDNRNIHLAQAANCGSNVVAISKGSDAVPSVTGDCAAVVATSVSPSSTSSRVSSSTSTSRSSSRQTTVIGGGGGATSSTRTAASQTSSVPVTSAASAATSGVTTASGTPRTTTVPASGVSRIMASTYAAIVAVVAAGAVALL